MYKVQGTRCKMKDARGGRFSLSLPSNIAEGHERNSDKERIIFLNYAKGSAGGIKDADLYWNRNWVHQP